ncbi:MAG: hypothetical protein AABX85_02120 [Nanoarchaeota archaeon]|mgnify:FL=1
MRRILTKEEMLVKEKRRNRIISFVILVIMLGSTVGFAFVFKSDNSNGDVQNLPGKLYNYGDKWAAEVDGQQFVFSSSPGSINSTDVVLLSTPNQFYGKPLYIDTSSQNMYSEIASTLGRYAERVQEACYSSCENITFAEKTCEDNLIVIKPAEKNKVYQNQSCVFIEGDMRAVDAFLYKLFDLS